MSYPWNTQIFVGRSIRNSYVTQTANRNKAELSVYVKYNNVNHKKNAINILPYRFKKVKYWLFISFYF